MREDQVILSQQLKTAEHSMALGRITLPISLSMMRFCLGWTHTDLVQVLSQQLWVHMYSCLAVCWRHNSFVVNYHLWLFNFLSPLLQLFLSLWMAVEYKCSLQEYEFFSLLFSALWPVLGIRNFSDDGWGMSSYLNTTVRSQSNNTVQYAYLTEKKIGSPLQDLWPV